MSGLSLNSSFNMNMNPSFSFSSLNRLPFPIQTQTLGIQDPHPSSFSFTNPGELYNRMHSGNPIRTNPLVEIEPSQRSSEEPEYSNGYDRAISDYAAALQERYGSGILGGGGAASYGFSSRETSQQPRGSLEVRIR